MSKKFQCKKCNKHYKKLTKEELCAFCYQDEHGTWSKEFQEDKKK
jgi:transposase-like protein